MSERLEIERREEEERLREERLREEQKLKEKKIQEEERLKILEIVGQNELNQNNIPVLVKRQVNIKKKDPNM